MSMRRIMKRRSGKVGDSPGVLVHIGDVHDAIPHLSALRYHPDGAEDLSLVDDVVKLAAGVTTDSVTWINLDGLHDVELVKALGSAFSLHSLILEDILDTDHRPKLEVGENFLFLIAKKLTYDTVQEEILSEQISIVVGSGFVLSFQEKPGPLFDLFRQRILVDQGRVRKMGADYLAYRLLDTMVDNYFVILEQMGDHIEKLEEELLTHPDRLLLHHIHLAKREMILLRRAVWPLREVIGGLQRADSGIISPEVQPFLRDLYDHTIQIIDTVETYRDIITGLLDLYMSSLSNRMNEIMKFLTIMSTLFIPLTFMVGIYGMNFDNLPELRWHWGYFALWGVMLSSVGGMLVFFRRKGWL
jgi:magnesium transporter